MPSMSDAADQEVRLSVDPIEHQSYPSVQAALMKQSVDASVHAHKLVQISQDVVNQIYKLKLSDISNNTSQLTKNLHDVSCESNAIVEQSNAALTDLMQDIGSAIEELQHHYQHSLEHTFS
jgi:cytochrome c-type biogenesis protein CcmH/NrfF